MRLDDPVEGLAKMQALKKAVCKGVFLVAAMSSAPFVAAQVAQTNVAQITGYFTGWSADVVKVTLAGGLYNEGGCSIQDGYMVTKTGTNGYDTHVSALLAAYMSGKKVQLAISGCAMDRPQIIGVAILP